MQETLANIRSRTRRASGAAAYTSGRRVKPPIRAGGTLARAFRIPSLLSLAFLIAVAVLHCNAIRALPHTLPLDSIHVYLPGALKLLDQGLAFFETGESIRTAPLNFIWPALYGGDIDAIVSGNTALSVLCLVLIYFTARVLAGQIAGVAGALLYGLSPLVPPLFTTVLSEPLFMAGTMLWIFGTTYSVLRSPNWIFAAVAGGTISLLTRPLLLPFLVISLPILAIAWIMQPSEKAWRRMATIHALVLVPAVAYTLHNASQFGFFGISAGGGVALYLGNHPLTLGVEPRFLLFDYDVQSMLTPWGGDHLSIDGDRALRRIGWSMIWDRSLIEQVRWLTYKLGAAMFFTKDDFPPELYSVRALRVFEWCFAFYGLAAVRSRPLLCWIIGAVSLQIAQLMIILYNQRYSIGALELWLIVLAGCGIARGLAGLHGNVWRVASGIRVAIDFDRSVGKFSERAVIVAIVAVGIGVAHWHRRLTDPLQPDIERVPTRTLLQLDRPELNEQLSENIVRMPNGAYFVGGAEGLFAVNIPAPPQGHKGANQVWSLALTIVPPDGKECHGGRISYESFEPRTDIVFSALPIEFKGDGTFRRYAISATYPLSPLHPGSEGVLRFRPFCPRNTQLAVHEVALLESTAPLYYLPRAKSP